MTPSNTQDLTNPNGATAAPSYATELWIGASSNSAIAVAMAGDLVEQWPGAQR